MEILEIFDKNNKLIGKERRDIIHSSGFFHRTVSIFLFNSKGEMLLQKRSAKKDVCPLAWDLSAAEHLKPSESYAGAASRCLKEELGIEADAVRIRDVHLQKNEYHNGKIKDYEFVELYKTVHDGKINIDKNEVSESRFLDIKHVHKMMRSNKKQFTPWFVEEWKNVGNASKFL